MSSRCISLVTLLAFGCATVRIPAGSPNEPSDAPGVIAPPVVELWLESSDEVPPEVAADADADARAALASALSGHAIARDALGARDAVLFARERAVGLTDARRRQQTWAKVGIVAGAVVVVAAIVGAIVLRGKGGSAAAAKAAPAAHATAPIPVRPRATPIRPVTPVVAPVARGYPGPRFPIFFGFAFWIPPRPLVLEPDPDVEEPWWTPDPPAPLAPRGGSESLASIEPPPPDPDLDQAPGVALQLPPLADAVNFAVEERGFFAGPRTALQLDLIDRATGRVLWSRAVSADDDPRDARAVAELVDSALAGQSWAARAR